MNNCSMIIIVSASSRDVMLCVTDLRSDFRDTGLRASGIQGFRASGLQGLGASGTQGLRDSGTRGLRDSGLVCARSDGRPSSSSCPSDDKSAVFAGSEESFLAPDGMP